MEENKKIELTEEEYEAYEAWLSGKTEEPKKEGALKKTGKFVRKHWKAFAIAGGAILTKVAYNKGREAGLLEEQARQQLALEGEVDDEEEDEETDEIE